MRKLTGSTIANIIVVLAIAVIPLMYAGLLTSAYQNPTNRVYTISAAVVNEDVAQDVVLETGRTEHFALGDELEERLTNPPEGQDVGFTWHSMSAAEAAREMGTEKIRAVLTIPADFTESTTRVATSEASRAARQKLELRTDDGVNYLAGTLARTVAVNLEDQLTAKGAEQYTDNVLMSIGTIRTGMRDAQSGAGALATGADTLQSGLGTLAEGTTTAASGAARLATGAQSAAQGASRAAAGGSALATGVDRLDAGASTLSAGVDQYTAGVDRAAAGAGTLASGLSSYTTGVDQAAAGASSLSSGVSQYAGGVDQLAGGSEALADGVDRYTAGVDQLHAQMPALESGVTTLAEGANRAQEGAAALATGLSTVQGGATQVASGASDLDTAVNTTAQTEGDGGLAAGIKSYTAGTSSYVDSTITFANAVRKLVCVLPSSSACRQLEALVSGGEQLRAQGAVLDAGVDRLSTATRGLDAGAAQVSAGVTQAKEGADDLAGDAGLPALAAGIGDLRKSVGSTDDSAQAQQAAGQQPTVYGALNDLASRSTALRSGAGELSSGLGTLSANSASVTGGTAQLSSGLSTLSSNSRALDSGASALTSGTQQLSATSPQLRSGASDVASGASQAADGADTLTVGLRGLADGTTTLATGTGQLSTGLDALDTGARTAADGATALGAGIAKLSDGLTEGVDRIPVHSAADSSHIASVISRPVVVDPVRDNAVANNGAGFTPMFMSLALWVGGIAIFLVLPALDRRPGPTEKWWYAPLRPAVTATLMGAGQAILMMSLTNWLVGLRAADVAGLVLVAVAASLTFVAVNQAAVAAMAYRGRFVSIILLSLQITSMGATFPIETTPRFFQWVHPFLPMSYTQLAFRSLIAGGGADHAVRNCLLVLAVWFLAAVACTFLSAFLRGGRRPLPRDNALLGDQLAEDARVRALQLDVDGDVTGAARPTPEPRRV